MSIVIHNNRIKTVLTNVPKYFYTDFLKSIKTICRCDAYYIVNRNSYTIVLNGNQCEGAIRFCQNVLHIPWQLKEMEENDSIPRRLAYSKHELYFL